MVPFAIEVIHGKKRLRVVRLELDVTYIGRMPENHIVVDDSEASRSHARIVNKKGTFVLEDQESENGTFVNGKKTSVCPLNLGDRITIGAYTLSVVADGGEARPAERKKQLEQAEKETWRSNQTVHASVEQLQALQAAGSSKEGRFPTMDFTLKLGNELIQETVTFDHGVKRDPSETGENSVEIRIKTGKWVLVKKVSI